MKHWNSAGLPAVQTECLDECVDLEFEPNSSLFDWNFGHAHGVEVARDRSATRSGNCSVRMSFAGTQNLDFTAACQLAFGTPGPYH
jgi:hypothetical protein